MTGLTRPIPDDAQPIVAIIRYGVPRPEELPTGRWMLRWEAARFFRGSTTCKECCSLGMLSSATHPTPVGPLTGIYGWDDAIEAFVLWHDEQHDPQALVDALWGPA